MAVVIGVEVPHVVSINQHRLWRSCQRQSAGGVGTWLIGKQNHTARADIEVTLIQGQLIVRCEIVRDCACRTDPYIAIPVVNTSCVNSERPISCGEEEISIASTANPPPLCQTPAPSLFGVTQNTKSVGESLRCTR